MSITLVSNDGQSFQVSRDIIRQIGTIDELFKDMGFDNEPDDRIEPIPCTSINGHILKMIIEYCTHHINDPEMREDDRRSIPLPQWDTDFFTKHKESLNELYMASHTLNVKKLTKACAQYIADSLNGKSTAEIGQIMGIKCDMTPEEQERIRKENAWCWD